jgi:hypothetical protein
VTSQNTVFKPSDVEICGPVTKLLTNDRIRDQTSTVISLTAVLSVMLRAVLGWVRARLGDSDGDTDERDEEDAQFAPSELDRSVRDAHGAGGAEQERELAKLQEKARELDDRRRN